ncbi:MAG: hypothetical protein RL662_41 [Bacteroidota bacterium]
MDKQYISSKRFVTLILDIGTFLLASGAHCGRVKSNIKRMADTWGFDINIQPTFKGLLMSAQSKSDDNDSITLFKESPPHMVNLQILTEVSHLSWLVHDQNLSIEDTEIAFSRIKKIQPYNRWIISVAVGISCAGLCVFSQGDFYNALVAFIAAFVGSICRFKITDLRFNVMISISFAAFITTLITGLGSLYDIGTNPDAAMATAVLYLIPGVPLINTVIDLIEGYLSSAINRAMFSALILMTIAVGMTLCISLLGIENFNL